MSRSVYFICNTPGTSGNFVGRMIKSIFPNNQIEITQQLVTADPPQSLTADYFYNNLTLPDGNLVVNVHFRPNYQRLREISPGCKIIVIKHTTHEIQAISRGLYKTYYQENYDLGAGPFYHSILNSHSHLFSNVNARPEDLSPMEKETFTRILAYHKLLDGFYNIEVPNDSDVLSLYFKDLFCDIAKVETQLETFTGYTFSESDKALNREVVNLNIQSSFLIR